MNAKHVLWMIAALSSSAAASPPMIEDTLGVIVSATSTLSTPKRYDVWGPLMADATHSRFWCEGKRDAGLGEALNFELSSPTKLDSVTIKGGVWKGDGALFKANNIVTGLEVITDDGRVQSVTLPEERKEVDVPLGGAPIKKLTLRITKVKPGKMNDSCISGVELHPASPRALVIGADDAALAALEPTFARLWHAVEDCDASVLGSQVIYPMAFVDTGTDRMRTTRYKDAAALRKACKGGKFSSLFTGTSGTYRVTSDAPGKVTMREDVLAWQLALDGGQWKLAGLEDDTP